jgi:hypothetical protein
MVPFDDRLPTDSTTGDLAICDWTPLSFCAPDPTGQRRDATLRRWPPPVAADQRFLDQDADVQPVAADTSDEPEGPLLIQSGAAFRAPDLALPVADGPVENDGYGQLLIQSGATFQAPDLEPGWHDLEEREDQSPLVIKSGTTFPVPDLDLDQQFAATDASADGEELELPRAHPVWRWSLNAVVVLVPVAVIIGLVLATDPPAPEAAPALTPKHATAVHGSLFPVEQAALAAVAAAKSQSSTPRSVAPVEANEATKKKDTAPPERTEPDRRLVPRLLTRARLSVRQRRWDRARLWAAATLKVSPRNRRARAIQRLAERKLRQKRRHLADARRAMKRGQWARARAHAKAALRVDPRNRRAKKIKQIAERRLRRRPRG